MAHPPEPGQVPPPGIVILAFLVVSLVVATWLMLHVNTSSASRECATRYRAAKTAADSARVDSLVPRQGSTPSVEAHSCRFIRYSARWS